MWNCDSRFGVPYRWLDSSLEFFGLIRLIESVNDSYCFGTNKHPGEYKYIRWFRCDILFCNLKNL